MRRPLIILALSLCMVTLAAACATLPVPEDLNSYRGDIDRLQQRLQTDSTDAQALRDLGLIYTRTGHFVQARSYLGQAYTYDASDPETQFYYGLSLESTGDREAALDVYVGYRAVPRLSAYRRRMAGRYQWLIREVVREELRDRLAQETYSVEAPPNTVAVFPLQYQGGDDRYEPLGRGMSEMVAVDLSQVQRLRVIERVRLNALLDELALGQMEAIDPGTAPRVGRLLGAQRMVGGSYAVLEGEVLRIDAGTWEVAAGQPSELATRSDALSSLFALEKDLVFGLLGELGIEPTPSEREAIEHVPTRNLQAFLAYSRGLLEEDAGRFGVAAGHFRQAATLDPAFSAAVESAEVVEGVNEVGGTSTEVAVSMVEVAPPAVGTEELLQIRQQNLGENVGTLYVPGQDARDTPSEEVTVLPPPRRPPPRGN